MHSLVETPDRDGAFPRLTEEQIALLRQGGRTRRTGRGDVLIREGQRGTWPYRPAVRLGLGSGGAGVMRPQRSLGAILGGFMASVMLGLDISDIDLTSLLVAAIGAALLIVILHALPATQIFE